MEGVRMGRNMSTWDQEKQFTSGLKIEDYMDFGEQEEHFTSSVKVKSDDVTVEEDKIASSVGVESNASSSSASSVRTNKCHFFGMTKAELAAHVSYILDREKQEEHFTSSATRHGTDASKSGPKPKKARKAITLETKLAVLKKYDEGMRVKDIASLFNLVPSTVVSIKKHKDKIMTSAKNATPLSAKVATKHRSSIMEEMERLLALWIDICSRNDSHVTNIDMQEKALSLYEDLIAKNNERAGPNSTTSSRQSFIASKGWLLRFKKRFNLLSVVQSRDAASADKEATQTYPSILKTIIAKGGYTAQQVFNVHETWLYWKRMPKRTVISKEEKKAQGYKASKDQMSLLVGGNAEGDFKVKPLLIHHSENPLAIKDHAKASLPVIYCSSKKAWSNRYIFQDWFTNYFCPAVQKYCSQKKISHKALLLLDNASSHPVNLPALSEHIKVEFLPKNTTSFLQPMNQGVISTFKAYYLRQMFKRIIKAVDTNKNLSVCQFWKDFDIKDAIDIVAESWQEIKDSNMNAVWKNLWPECVHSFAGFPQVQPVVREIVNLAHQVGMEEVEEEDIDELLASHSKELSNEELMAVEQERAAEEEATEEDEKVQLYLTSKILADAFSKIDCGIQDIVDNDPNHERSLEFEHMMESALNSYRQLYEEKIFQGRQSAMTSSFKTKVTAALTFAPANDDYGNAVASTSAAADANDGSVFEEEVPPPTLSDEDDVRTDSPKAYSSSTEDDAPSFQ